jgi:hypothetical protein
MAKTTDAVLELASAVNDLVGIVRDLLSRTPGDPAIAQELEQLKAEDAQAASDLTSLTERVRGVISEAQSTPVPPIA